MTLGLRPGPYLVIGTGRAGASAVAALARHAPPGTVRAWDAYDGPETWRRRTALEALGAAVTLGPWRDELLAGPAPGLVVKSPGVAATATPIAAALARGIPVVDELELGVRLSRRTFVAVTGTDGKSTVSTLIARALGAPGAPAPVAGNTEFGDPLSSVAPDGGPVVVETSSYQLEFTAPAFPRLAVLTNITPEHQARHGTQADYAAVKRRLFLGDGRRVPLAVVNADGAFGRDLAAELAAAGAQVATFGSGPADYRVAAVRSRAGGATVTAVEPRGATTLYTRLPGRYNAENALAALAASDLLGVERAASVAALKTFGGVPGRWERVGDGVPFEVIIDFAHTPAALRAVLTAAREVMAANGGGRLHLVLSASGRSSPAKRAPLGASGAALADHVVVTEAGLGGDPREVVIAEIVAGTDGGAAEVEVVPGRREAIRHALAAAAPGDIVLVNDRGARPRFITDPAGGGFAWDDRAVVREELRVRPVAGAGVGPHPRPVAS